MASRRQHIYPGKFIVIDGTDATGKKTQVSLLSSYLSSQNIRNTTLDFPRYYDNFWGKMVGSYLCGTFGGLYDNNPYLSTLPFILDQADSRQKIRTALRRETIIISNRYVSSNIHQAAKLPPSKRDEFYRWLDEAFYIQLHGVKPDLTIILNLPIAISHELLKQKSNRDYLKGKQADIAEKDTVHQQEAQGEYLRIACGKKDWETVTCTDSKGSLKTPKQIHQEIVSLLVERHWLPRQKVLSTTAP